MPKKIMYTEVADSIVQEDWHWADIADNIDLVAHINSMNDSFLQIILLADIAKSLRVLRCSNFTDLLRRIDRTRVAVEGLRRDTKGRARAHRRKL